MGDLSFLRYDVIFVADESTIRYCTYIAHVCPPIRNFDGTAADLHVYKYFEPVEYKGKMFLKK